MLIFYAEGVVVSTPTGSTGYAMALGGSITHPDVGAVLLNAMNPRSLSFRGLHLPVGCEIRLQVSGETRCNALLLIDGVNQHIELAAGQSIGVSLPPSF